ncbi:hypothetical protein [Gloeothece verrucosa]|uniref:Uncharacterized protein n=1 Tax=Gloeothece verrucosa (strain PCC 7822) TaxID=497965 RepID=E0UN12_GLOV7|nr:hypothetical protein [Gloeothece verrucosa]ADN18342.1 hypothetical protein Cyan7822_6587 [Gloeothece verrucosa PCC 7822]
MIASTTTFSPKSRQKLIATLYKLVPEQLEQLILILNPPAGIIPPLPASQGTRASAVVSWAESPSGRGLLQVQEALEIILEINFEDLE